MTTQFAELLKSLTEAEGEATVLAKAVGSAPAADDTQIQAAAEEGGAMTDEEREAAEAAAAAAADKGEGEGKPAIDPKAPVLAKSAEGAAAGEDDGEQYIDATEMLKSLQASVDAHDDVLAKAFTPILSAMKSQSEMLKSLHARVEQLAGAGRGRKTVVMALERPAIGDLTKSQEGAAAQEGQMTPEVFLTKANAAFDAKAITGLELTTISVSMRENKPIDAALIRKVALAG